MKTESIANEIRKLKLVASKYDKYYSKLQYVSMNDDEDYKRLFRLDDEEDRLIDAAMSKIDIDNQTISDEEIEKMIPLEMKDHAKSISRRRKYGSKLDEENIATSKMVAAIEGDDELFNAAEDELEYRKHFK